MLIGKNLKKRIVLIAASLTFNILTTPLASAQVAGLNTLSLLKMPSSAHTAALGVNYLPLFAPYDLNVGLDNPSLISPHYDRRLTLNYVGLFSGSNFGSVAYGLDTRRLGAFLLSFHFNSYGRFQGFDEEELEHGTFGASDVAFSVAWGMNIDSNFSIGASLRPVLSQYESYTAFALALNVAGSYISDDKRFAATVQGRNIGAQLATFDDGGFQIQLAGADSRHVTSGTTPDNDDIVFHSCLIFNLL